MDNDRLPNRQDEEQEEEDNRTIVVDGFDKVYYIRLIVGGVLLSLLMIQFLSWILTLFTESPEDDRLALERLMSSLNQISSLMTVSTTSSLMDDSQDSSVI
jgi:hypothetical protein